MNPDFNKEDSEDLTLKKDQSVDNSSAGASEVVRESGDLTSKKDKSVDNNSAGASEVVIESEKDKNSTQLVLDKEVLPPVAVSPLVHKDSLELNAFSTEVESNVTVEVSNSKVIPEPEKEKNSNIFDIDDELCGSYEEKAAVI